MQTNKMLPVLESSVFRLGLFNHWTGIARPCENGDDLTQLADVLCQLEQSLESSATPQDNYSLIYRLSIFVANRSRENDYRRIVRTFFGDRIPVLELIYQAPCSGCPFVVEAWGLTCPNEDMVKMTTPQQDLSILEYDNLKWYHCTQCPGDIDNPLVYPRSLHSFKTIEDRYKSISVPFSDVVRTWIYLGDIVGPEGQTQRYKELNRARTDFFGDTLFCRKFPSPLFEGDAYPASTGIGSDGKGVVISALALDSDRKDVIAVPLENPHQTSAFNYGRVYSPQSPKFARALGVKFGSCGVIFISGTASITDAESRFIDDPVRQTNCTLDNIEVLIDKNNCAQHGLDDFGAKLTTVAYLRVYIKNANDFPAIQEACRKRCGDRVPMSFTITDVCRPELLVEIEGVAFSN